MKAMNLVYLSVGLYISMEDRCIPDDERDLLVRELAIVHARGRIRLVQPSLEQVGTLIELAELPLRVRRI